MADVSILDINGSQWNFKDTEARSQIANIITNLETVEEIEVANLNRGYLTSSWNTSNGFRGKLFNIAQFNFTFKANSVSYNYRTGTEIFRIKNLVPLCPGFQPTITAVMEQYTITHNYSGNDFVIYAGGSTYCRINTITVSGIIPIRIN